MSRPELTAWLNDIITSVIDQRRSQLTASAALADDDNGITASRSLAGLNRKISEYAKGVNWHNLNHLTAEAFAVNLLSNDSTIDTQASLSEIIDRLGDIEMRDIAISIVRKVAENAGSAIEACDKLTLRSRPSWAMASSASATARSSARAVTRALRAKGSQ
jgi:hypothetical protein